MACPIALLATRVGPMLAGSMVEYPHVRVHLDATNRRVDVIGEGLDVAIRVRPPPLQDSDLVMRVLADRGQCLVASPTLLARHGVPQGPAELANLPSLDLGVPQNEHVWHLYGPEGAEATVYHQPRYITRGMLALREAALSGVGIVQLPTMVVTEHMAKGALIHLVPQWAPRREIVHAVFASRRGLLPSVRLLIDYLAERFERITED